MVGPVVDDRPHLAAVGEVVRFYDAHVGVGKTLGVAFHYLHPIGDAHVGIE